MNKAIKFTTPKGSKIELAVVTKKASLADHTVMVPCYELWLTANGSLLTGGHPEVIDDAVQGKCLKQRFGKVIIPIPAEKVREVEEMISCYEAGVSRRVEAEIKADQDYMAHRNAVLRMMDH